MFPAIADYRAEPVREGPRSQQEKEVTHLASAGTRSRGSVFQAHPFKKRFMECDGLYR